GDGPEGGAEGKGGHTAKEGGKYALDKPYLRVTVIPVEKKGPAGDDKRKDEERKDAAKERVLLVGKPADKDGKARYAKLGDGDAVFVVGEKLVAAVDHGALDLLERRLLSLDPKTVERVTKADPKDKLALRGQKDDWQIPGSPAGGPFPADRDVTATFLGLVTNLKAQRYVAYGPKADAARYGLDKPERGLTLAGTTPG